MRAQQAVRLAEPPPRVTLTVLGTASVVRPEPGAGCDYQLCGSIAQLREYLRPALHNKEAFGADWEATSLNTHLARPCGLSVSVTDTTALYVPVGHWIEPAANLPVGEVVQVLKDADAAGAASLWYYVGYDFEVSHHAFGWEPEHWHDVLLGVALADPAVYELGLKASSLRFLGEPMRELSELDPEWAALPAARRAQTPYRLPHQLSPAVVMPYGCDDATKTRRLWRHPDIVRACQRQAWVLTTEQRLTAVLRRGNRHGVYLDAARLDALHAETTTRLAALQAAIWDHLGERLVLSRKGVLAQRLLALGVPIVERTPSGAPTVSVKVLRAYTRAHPVIPLLIQHAQLVAQRDNYIAKLQRAHAYFAQQPWAEGRVRFKFGQVGVPTGRMKCGGGGKGPAAYREGVADVNAQSIPDAHKADTWLPNLRSAFIAPPGFVVVALDYDQMELRITANESGEPRWIQAYQEGRDLHLANAQAIADVLEPGTQVLPTDSRRRGAAKSVSFALTYGGDAHTISRNASLPLPAAQRLLDAFFAHHRTLQRWMQQVTTRAEATQSVTTRFGRLRPLTAYFSPEPPKPTSRFEDSPRATRWRRWKQSQARGHREALNDPIQGGAADVFKYACAQLHDAFRPYPEGVVSPQVLWLHDEVVFYVHHDWVTRLVPLAQTALQVPVRGWPVPLTTSAEIGSRRLTLARQRTICLQAGGDPSALDAALSDPALEEFGRGSSWGELVPYADWVAHYQPD